MKERQGSERRGVRVRVRGGSRAEDVGEEEKVREKGVGEERQREGTGRGGGGKGCCRSFDRYHTGPALVAHLHSQAGPPLGPGMYVRLLRANERM